LDPSKESYLSANNIGLTPSPQPMTTDAATAAAAAGPPPFRPDKRPGMRAVLAVAMGALAFGAVSAAGLLASRAAIERLRQGAAAELTLAARHIAETLDRGMFERWRDVQVAAAHPVLTDPAAAPDAKREVLRLLDRTYPDYALVFLIRPDGRIEVTSRGILEGVDVSRRDYFVGGRAGPFVGDVHEAILLAKYLDARPNGEPPRFVDLAAPVVAPDGRPAGVIAAHLFWDWAENVERAVLEPLKAQRPGTEALVLARDGTVLLGPAATRGGKLADLGSIRAARAGEAGARLERWPAAAAAKEFLVGYAPTRGHRGYPGLGWTVLLRQDTAAAYAAAEALEREILLWAAAVALVAAAMAWLLAHAATRPIRALTAVVARLAREPGAAPDAEREAARLARGSVLHEGAALGAAMAGLIGSHRRAAAALGTEKARLRAVLDRMPVGVALAEAPSGRLLFHNRRAAELVGHPMPAARDVSGYTAYGAVLASDENAPLPPEAYPLARAALLGETVEQEEMRYRRGDGRLTWFEVSAARIADPAGGAFAVATFADVAERKQAERQRELLIAELNHRVKNMLATVQSLASQTSRGPAGADTGRFVQEFNQRLRTLARAHDLIAAGSWDEADLEAVARAALAPLLINAEPGGRVRLEGPAGVRIGPREAQALALALHELATNALKHGALCVPGGRVALRWRSEATPAAAAPGDGRIALDWLESGGPALAGPPARRGFGTRLLERGLARDLGAGAEVKLDFAPAGLRAAIRFNPPPHRGQAPVPAAVRVPDPFGRGGGADRRRTPAAVAERGRGEIRADRAPGLRAGSPVS
jgi:PAS domain S-box-containing protein